MYAIIKSGGKQYKAEIGRTLDLEKINAEQGQTIAINNVIMAINNENKLQIGSPFIEGAQVDVEVIKQGRMKKVNILKFKRRKHHMKRMGHRQWFTKVKVVDIKTA